MMRQLLLENDFFLQYVGVFHVKLCFSLIVLIWVTSQRVVAPYPHGPTSVKPIKEQGGPLQDTKNNKVSTIHH